MPYPNEHAARLRNPDDFDPKSFRRTHGSGDGRVQGVKIPETIDVIWGKLKDANKPSDPVIAQALRFPVKNWTEAEARNWLKKNEIKYIDFEPAKKEEKMIEYRTHTPCELREDGEQKYIEGYACVFGQESRDLGGFVEVIDAKAFDGCEMNDVSALFNHDGNLLLARKFGDFGTLKLQIDSNGLRYSFPIPNHYVGELLAESIKRGDVLHSSFAFTIAEDEFLKKDGKRIRTIKKFRKLYDVSPVVNPAYYVTSVTMRDFGEEEPEKKEMPQYFYDREKLELIKFIV